MRKLIIYVCALFSLTGTVRAQERAGIRFFQGTWKELLATAQKRHQPVFVDVYTDWCGPCKRMDKEIFVLPEVGEFYNTNFICYRLNAEKGEGPRLAKTYGVSAYPTWLYLDSAGTLRSRQTDYMAATAFIEAGKVALGKDSVSVRLRALGVRFQDGERTPAFLRTYLETRTALQLDNSEVLNVYVAGLQKKTLSAEELRFLVRNSGRTWSAAVPLITSHLQVFEIRERKKIAAEFFGRTLYFAWGDAVKADNRKVAEQGIAAAERLYPLLSEAQQLTADHATLYHCRMLRMAAGLKKIGYRLAEKQMAVDTTFARRKDKELYDQVMAPFLSGQQDSTKIPGFTEEKRLAATQYSGKTASLLYEVAEAFAEVLSPGGPAQRDAARWAERAYLLLPNEHTRALSARLSGNSK